MQIRPRFRHRLMSTLKNQNGSTLVVSMLVVGVVMFMGLSATKITAATSLTGANDQLAQKAMYLAQAGLEIASERIYAGDDPTLTHQPLLQGQVTVSYNADSDLIVAQGQYGGASKTLARKNKMAAECIDVDFSGSQYFTDLGTASWSHLEKVKIQKTCNELATLKIRSVTLEFDTPSFTRLVKHMHINDKDVLYHVPSTLVPDYPDADPVGIPNSGAESLQTMTTQSYHFVDNGVNFLDVWWNTSFKDGNTPIEVRVTFEDGSTYRSQKHTL